MDHREELADGGTVTYHTGFFDRAEADALLSRLRERVAWRRETGRFNRPFPRLTAYFGDEGVDYSYSGVTHRGAGWPDWLVAVKTRVEVAAATDFNSVLLNRYRNQCDSMGYHADDEPELGMNPIIASVSVGATRVFHLRHNQTRERRSYELAHGSLLIMAGTLQHHWQHAIPRRSRTVGERINLTFRKLLRLQ